MWCLHNSGLNVSRMLSKSRNNGFLVDLLKYDHSVLYRLNKDRHNIFHITVSDCYVNMFELLARSQFFHQMQDVVTVSRLLSSLWYRLTHTSNWTHWCNSKKTQHEIYCVCPYLLNIINCGHILVAPPRICHFSILSLWKDFSSFK